MSIQRSSGPEGRETASCGVGVKVGGRGVAVGVAVGVNVGVGVAVGVKVGVGVFVGVAVGVGVGVGAADQTYPDPKQPVVATTATRAPTSAAKQAPKSDDRLSRQERPTLTESDTTGLEQNRQ